MPLYLLGSQGRNILRSGILFYKTRVRNSIFILFLTCLQASDVSCNIVCVHQVAELLYLNVPFASMWVLGIMSLIIIKGDAMVFIILYCAGNWTQNLMYTRHSTLFSNISNPLLHSLKMFGMLTWSYERSCWHVSFAVPAATANLDRIFKLH